MKAFENTSPILIKNIRTCRLDIPLKQSYDVAYAHYDTVENVVVRVEDSDGRVGWGCAAPDEHVTGETADTVCLVLRKTLIPGLKQNNATAMGQMLQIIERTAPDAPAARAALDIALHDLRAKQNDKLLIGMSGTVRVEMPTFITLGLDDVENTVSQACACAARGFHQFKIKGGRNADEDIARVRAVRRALEPDAMLCLDANQGYSERDALLAAKELAGEIVFMEQPVQAHDLTALAAVARESSVPIMADESVVTAVQAAAALDAGVQLLCVKLMKHGGIVPARRICDMALARGAQVMIGCMDELHISMAAAAHLALSHPAVAYADLDGHLDLDQNITNGGIIINNGMVSVSCTPGLGVSVDESALEPFAVDFQSM